MVKGDISNNKWNKKARRMGDALAKRGELTASEEILKAKATEAAEKWWKAKKIVYVKWDLAFSTKDGKAIRKWMDLKEVKDEGPWWDDVKKHFAWYHNQRRSSTIGAIRAAIMGELLFFNLFVLGWFGCFASRFLRLLLTQSGFFFRHESGWEPVRMGQPREAQAAAGGKEAS